MKLVGEILPELLDEIENRMEKNKKNTEQDKEVGRRWLRIIRYNLEQKK